MINKIFNIVIYAHIAENAIDGYFSNNPDAAKNASDLNVMPDHLKEYLSEKSDRYLGIDFNKIDHNKLFTIIHGTLLVDDIDKVINQFESVIHNISDEENLQLKVTSDNPIPGWVIHPFRVTGADHIVTSNIETYLSYIPESEVIEIIRDLKIKNILT